MAIKQPSPADEDHFENVAESMLEGMVVPFLGAGVNLCGRDGEWVPGKNLPNAGELAEMLIKKGTYPDETDRNLMRISQYVESVKGWGRLYGYLRKTFDGDYEPTTLHRLLADTAQMLRARDTPRQVLLTTNYDDALERAFDDLDPPEPYHLIWYEAQEDADDFGRFIHDLDKSRVPAADAGGRSRMPITDPSGYYAIDPDERTVIVKLHGAMVRANKNEDSYVITEDDYINYLTTDIQLALPALVRQRISESHLLFLGYSMADWNLRVLLQRLAGGTKKKHKYQSWAVQRVPDSEESAQIELTLWGERDMDLLFVDLDEYVSGLRAKLTAYAQAA